ncbi:MAG: cyanophycinase [Phycisphaeraceae bacterium]|nr:cyanophycinase [Phycisphaeraceae bacterium]
MTTWRPCAWAAASMAVLLVLGACSRPAAPSGHLMIAGGALADDNALVWGRFAELSGEAGVIGVVPTATGVANPGRSTAETLTRYAGSRKVEILPLTKDDAANAMDADVAARVRACTALWFVGGDQSRILAVFRQGTGDSPAYRASMEVLAAGGVIGGSSAGAAMMSDPMITGGTSEASLVKGARNGAKGAAAGAEPDTGEDEDGPRPVGIAKGMGYFPYGLTDQHFLQRGRLGRLVVALEETDIQRGYGVAENSAIDVALGTGSITVLGDAGMLLVDMSGAKRSDGARRGIRLSLLSTGDVVDGASGKVSVSSARKEMAKRMGGPVEIPSTMPEAWRKNMITRLLRELPGFGGAPLKASDANYQIVLTADERTTFWADPARPSEVTVVDARMDIVPK